MLMFVNMLLSVACNFMAGEEKVGNHLVWPCRGDRKQDLTLQDPALLLERQSIVPI